MLLRWKSSSGAPPTAVLKLHADSPTNAAKKTPMVASVVIILWRGPEEVLGAESSSTAIASA